MEVNLDKKQLNLLLKLSKVLSDLDALPLLESLGQRELHHHLTPSPLPTPQTEPSLLQRLSGSKSLETLKRQSSHSEAKASRKRLLSPQSSEYSGRTLMSCLLNPKRIQLLTPISQRSSPSRLPLMSPRSRGIPIQIPQDFTSHCQQRTRFPHKVLGRTGNQSTLEMNQTGIDEQNGRSLSSWICLGTQNPPNLHLSLATPVAKKPVGYFEPSIEMSPKPNSSSRLHTTLPQESPHLNESVSLKKMPSTSIKSSHHSTILSLMKREQAAWVKWKSLLESLNQRNIFPQLQNGLPPGEKPQKLLPLPSPIEGKNSWNTVTTLRPNSPPKLSLPITKSSSMIQPCVTKSQQGSTSSSLTTTDSAGYTQPSLCPTELSLPLTNHMAESQGSQGSLLKTAISPKSVTSSTPERASTLAQIASTNTGARTAINQDTERKTVRMGANEIYGLQPKYLWHNLWDQSLSLSPTTAEWSETARPLPRPPLSEISNPFSSHTIANHPDLFQVLTPIKVDVFESLLKDHPNPLFVKSVCDGLREGFWPWADTSKDGYPITHDKS